MYKINDFRLRVIQQVLVEENKLGKYQNIPTEEFPDSNLGEHHTLIRPPQNLDVLIPLLQTIAILVTTTVFCVQQSIENLYNYMETDNYFSMYS